MVARRRSLAYDDGTVYGTKGHHRIVAGVVGLLVVGWGCGAWAQDGSPADRAAAEALFREGRALMQADQVALACRKFEESFRLEAAPGTLLNVAHCHMREGKVATAWAEFQRVATEARQTGHAARERIARESIAELEPRLPRLSLRVAAQARDQRVIVRRDGTVLGPASWDTETPVDPGTVLIEVTGPGLVPWTRSFTATEGELLVVEVPALSRRPVVVESPRPLPPAPSAPPPDTSSPLARHSGIILGSVGLGAIGVGAYFGLQAKSKLQDSDDACPLVQGDRRCTERGVALNQEAKDAARLSNLGIGVGVVAVMAGAYLYLYGQPGGSPNSAATVRSPIDLSVQPVRGGAAASLTGGW